MVALCPDRSVNRGDQWWTHVVLQVFFPFIPEFSLTLYAIDTGFSSRSLIATFRETRIPVAICPPCLKLNLERMIL